MRWRARVTARDGGDILSALTSRAGGGDWKRTCLTDEVGLEGDAERRWRMERVGLSGETARAFRFCLRGFGFGVASKGSSMPWSVPRVARSSGPACFMCDLDGEDGARLRLNESVSFALVAERSGWNGCDDVEDAGCAGSDPDLE